VVIVAGSKNMIIMVIADSCGIHSTSSSCCLWWQQSSWAGSGKAESSSKSFDEIKAVERILAQT